LSIAETTLVLFDLDGTLADTAPDLAGAANRMRVRRGLEPLPYERLRPMASHGARGLIGAAFGITPQAPDYVAWRDEFLAEYASQLCVETRLFPGMDRVLRVFEERGVNWGIVTNKAARFTEPLVHALQLQARAACVVSGDTTGHTKPHPAPVLHALAVCGRAAEHALYVGDDARDVTAGRAANVRTVAVRYGYLGADEPIESWGADHVIDEPGQILELLPDGY
jgi:phosphoglycolate phosphatase